MSSKDVAYRNKNHKRLDCLLFLPPVSFQLVSPEIGLPQLSAYLNAHGVQTQAHDLNRLFIRSFIQTQKKAVSSRIKERMRNCKDTPLFKEIDKERLAQLDLSGCFDSFSNFIRAESFYVMNELVSVTGNVYDMRKIVRIIQKTDDELFDIFFKAYIQPYIRRAGLIGFSILGHHQLTSALYFTKLIKRLDARKKVVIGGPWCICSRNNLTFFKDMFALIDVVCVGEGEIPLQHLAVSVRNGFDAARLRLIPGIAFLEDDTVIDTGDTKVVKLDDLPRSDFTNFNPRHYEEGYIPILTTKGCYWGKCEFCHHNLHGTAVRSKNASTIVEEIKFLTKKYNTQKIEFADSSTPLTLLVKIAEGLISRKVRANWSCLLRADSRISREQLDILKRSGCTGLCVGLECSDQGSLDRMDKGIDLSVLDEFLDNALHADITVQLFIMNYPALTKTRYSSTWQYLFFRREKIFDVVPQDFHLGRSSLVFSHPEKYKISQPRDNQYDIRSFSLPHIVKGGMDREEFFQVTVNFSRRFHAMHDNHTITRRIFHAGRKQYLLIRPPALDGRIIFKDKEIVRRSHGYTEPTSLLKIGNFLKTQGHGIEIIDCLENTLYEAAESSVFRTVRCGNYEQEGIEKKLYKRGMKKEEFKKRLKMSKEPDEIYITSHFTWQADLIKEIVEMCKERYPDVPISVGGICASLCHERIQEFGCDAFVGTFHLVNNLEPDLGLLDYTVDSSVVKFSRGCVNSCKYCAVPYIEGKYVYFRPLESVINEITVKYKKFGIKKFIFWESNVFGIHNDYFQKLLKAIEDLGMDITLQFPEGLQPNLVSPQIARKLKEANANLILLAFESADSQFTTQYRRPRGAAVLSYAVENLISEKVYTPFFNAGNEGKVGTQARTESGNSSVVSVFVLIGLPGQKKQDVIRTIIEVWKTGAAVCFTPFTPIPRTATYKEHEAFLKPKALVELYPLVWPFASAQLPVDFLERVQACNDTNSFFQVYDKTLCKDFRQELVQYIQTVSINDIETALKDGMQKRGFRIIGFRNISRSNVTIESINKIKKYLLMLVKNKVVFYLEKPVSPCILKFNKSWHLHHIPFDCEYCLKVDCSKRHRKVKGSAYCRGCKYLNNPCKDCMGDT